MYSVERHQGTRGNDVSTKEGSEQMGKIEYTRALTGVGRRPDRISTPKDELVERSARRRLIVPTLRGAGDGGGSWIVSLVRTTKGARNDTNELDRVQGKSYCLLRQEADCGRSCS